MGKRGDTRWDGAKERYVGENVDYDAYVEWYSALDDLDLGTPDKMAIMRLEAIEGIPEALDKLLNEIRLDEGLKYKDSRLRMLIQAERIKLLAPLFPDWEFIYERLRHAALEHQLPFYSLTEWVKDDKQKGWLFTAQAGDVYKLKVSVGPANKSYQWLYALLDAKGEMLTWEELGISKQKGADAKKQFIRGMKRLVVDLREHDKGLPHLADMIDALIPRNPAGKKPVKLSGIKFWQQHEIDPRFEHRKADLRGMFQFHGQNTGVALRYPPWYEGPRLSAGAFPEAAPPGEYERWMDHKQFKKRRYYPTPQGSQQVGCSDKQRNPFVECEEGGVAQAHGQSRGRHGMGTKRLEGERLLSEMEFRSKLLTEENVLGDPETAEPESSREERTEVEPIKPHQYLDEHDKPYAEKLMPPQKADLRPLPKAKTRKIKSPTRSDLRANRRDEIEAAEWEALKEK
jgi:hypothetical protein